MEFKMKTAILITSAPVGPQPKKRREALVGAVMALATFEELGRKPPNMKDFGIGNLNTDQYIIPVPNLVLALRNMGRYDSEYWKKQFASGDYFAISVEYCDLR